MQGRILAHLLRRAPFKRGPFSVVSGVNLGLRTSRCFSRFFRKSNPDQRAPADLPQDWAMTRNNLGNALQVLGTRSGGEEGRKLLRGPPIVGEFSQNLLKRAGQTE